MEGEATQPIDRDARIMARRQRISERIAAAKGGDEDNKRKQKGEKEHEESRSKAQIA